MIVRIAALAVAACGVATEGVCGATLGRVIIGAAIGAASNVAGDWVNGSCGNLQCYATDALRGLIAGGLGSYMTKGGFSAYASKRFQGSMLSLLTRAFSKLRYWL